MKKHALDPVVGDLSDSSNFYVDDQSRLRCKAMKCPFCDGDLWIKTKGKDFFVNVCPECDYHYILYDG